MMNERQPAFYSSFITPHSSLLFCLLFAVATGAAEVAAQGAQHQPHQWGAITLFHGLPSERVRAIAQDAEGALWFGTDAGLARYDGRRTQALGAAELPATNVRALAVDRRGVLWVGTAAGVARRVGGGFQIVEATRGRDVRAMLHVADGRTLLACADAILECHTADDGSLRVEELAALPDEDRAEVTSIARGADGALLVGTRGRGVLRVAEGATREVVTRPRAYFVEAVTADPSGAVWFGAQTSAAGAGLFRINFGETRSRAERIELETGGVRALLSDEAGALWVGTAERGVFRLGDGDRVDRWTFAATAGNLLSDNVNAIFIDRERVVWFATERGVCRYDPGAMQGETISEDLDANFVRAFYTTATGDLFGGTNRGLFLRRSSGDGWKPVARLADETIHSVGEDASGRLLVGTSRGLFIEEFASDGAERYTRFTFISDTQGERRSVRAITPFRGDIYLGIYGAGVERLDVERRAPVKSKQPDDTAESREVTSLYAEGTRRLWIGTARGGVWRVDESGVVAHEPALAALRGRAVWDIEEQGGALWFATSDGLYLFRDGALRHIVEGVDVRGFYPDSDARQGETSQGQGARVWCATDGDGLLSVRVSGDAVITTRFGVEHGLPTQHVFAVTGLSGEEQSSTSLLVGTSRGAARYTRSSVAPLVSLARVGDTIVGDGTAAPATFRLAYPQNDFALDIAAVSTRTFPEQFRYRFELQDERGRVIATRFAGDTHLAFENLAPGNYAIEARAFSADLLASAPLRFAVEVSPAPFPWTTAWLSALLGLTLAALVWGASQNRRIRRTSFSLAEANRELATARLALATEAETERRRIARDLHDQTLADLRRLMLRADEIGDARAEINDALTQLDSTALRREVEAISIEVRRICEDLSPSVLENVGFAAALEWAVAAAIEQLPATGKFNYHFVCDENFDTRLRLKRASQIQIYRIVQEALSNISRHAGAQTVVLTADITDDDETLRLRLEDDGRGFDLNALPTPYGRGLTNIRARALLIGAEVEWLAHPAHGTIFHLRVANKS